MIDQERLEAELFRYLREELRLPGEITRETELVRTGLIDSTDLVLVATHLERTFDIEIPDADIDVDHFDSVAMIWDYVRERQGG